MRFPIVAMLLMASGCSTLNPSVREFRNFDRAKSGVLTTESNLRSSYLLPRMESGAEPATIVCAEPPPDTALAIAAKTSLSGKGGRIGADASADAVVDYNTAVVQLAGRSSTVLLARDMLFNICVLRANKFLNNEQVGGLYAETIKLVRDIATVDKLQGAARALQSGAPAASVAAILSVSERELKVTLAAAKLMQVESEDERRGIVTPIFACGDTDKTCREQRDAIIAERDLTTLTSKIARQSDARVAALYLRLVGGN